jgi:hypothetical protein
MSIYLRLKRKATTVFVTCEPQEKIGEVKKRTAQILDVPPTDIRVGRPRLFTCQTVADSLIYLMVGSCLLLSLTGGFSSMNI